MYRSKYILRMNLVCTNLYLDYKQPSIISHLIQKKNYCKMKMTCIIFIKHDTSICEINILF